MEFISILKQEIAIIINSLFKYLVNFKGEKTNQKPIEPCWSGLCGTDFNEYFIIINYKCYSVNIYYFINIKDPLVKTLNWHTKKRFITNVRYLTFISRTPHHWKNPHASVKKKKDLKNKLRNNWQSSEEKSTVM